MTDRDTFAAAALTGLIVSMREESMYELCESAYGWADAMIRQRGTAVSHNCVAGNQSEIPCPVTEPMPVVVSGSGSVTPVSYVKHDEKRVDWHMAGETNHDAAPAAKVRTDADRNRTDKAAIRPGEGTGDSTGPVAWALVYPNDEVAVIAFRRRDAAERASASDRIVPLYRQPQPALTDAERDAVHAAMRSSPFCFTPEAKTLDALLARLA